MDIVEDDPLDKIHTLHDASNEIFVSKSKDIADKLGKAQTSKKTSRRCSRCYKMLIWGSKKNKGSSNN
ncbi:hypothetical protein OS11_11200 [Dickeya oryzae]